MTDEDRALYAEIMRDFGQPAWACQDARDGIDDDDAPLDRIAAHRQAAYAAGLERAAVIAENYGGKTAYVLAAAIRAEKDKT